MTADPLAGDPPPSRSSRALSPTTRTTSAPEPRRVARGAEDAAEWQGASKERFSATVGTIAPAAQRMIDRIDAAIDVLETYADEVQRIQDEAERIRASQLITAMDTAVTAVSLSTAQLAASAKDATDADTRQARRLQSDADDLAATASRLDAEWDALVNGGPPRTALLRRGCPTLSPRRGALVRGDARQDERRRVPRCRRRDAARSPRGGRTHRRRAARRHAARDRTAWWDGLGGRGSAGEHSAAQDALITALPAVIGNLNGVPYWARDQANRLSAQRAYAQASEALHNAQDKYAKAGRAGLNRRPRSGS